MTKKEALCVLGSLAGTALLPAAGLSHVLWHRGRRGLAAATLAAGFGADSLLLSAFLIPNLPLTGRMFFRGCRTGGSIALTFDDGPRQPFTGQILDVLKREEVRATFFVLGENAMLYPETVKRMAAEGHRVANHGMDHDILMWAAAGATRMQLKLTDQALREAGANDPAPLFRPPHGWLSPLAHRAVTAAGYKVVGWTKGVWDTASPGVEQIISRTAEVLEPGSILLLHDGWRGSSEEDRSQTVAALPGIINEARVRGLAFATVEELIGQAEGGCPA